MKSQPGASADPTRAIAILGGGVCGLAAAWRLLQSAPGRRVVVYESEAETGGLARSLNFGGLRADLGPHRFHTELAESLNFIREIARDEWVETPRRSLMWLAGRWVDYPPRPAEMLKALGPFKMFGFSLSYALSRVAGFMDFLSGGEDGRESFESLMRGAFGRRLYEFLLQPYASKVWKIPPGSIHADIARVRVSAGGLERLVRQAFSRARPTADPAALRQFLYIPGGIGRLADRMTEEIRRLGGEAHTGRAVTALRPPNPAPGGGGEPGAWTVVHARAEASPAGAQTPQLRALAGAPPFGDDLREERFGRVISTLPLPDLCAALLSARPDVNAQNSLAGLRYLANILVFVETALPPPTDAQWLYFPQRELIFNRGYCPANFHASMGAEGRSLLCLEVTCLPGDSLWSLTDADLAARVRDDAARIGLAPAASVRSTHVFRIPCAYPLYDLEYRWRVDRVLDYLAQFPGLLTAGRQGLFLHNNVDHSIYMGLEAAKAILAPGARPGPDWYRRIGEFRAFRIID